MNLDYYISLPQAKTILYRILTNIVQNSNLPIHQKEPFRVDDTTTTSFAKNKPPYQIIIGAKQLYDTQQNGLVNSFDLINTVISCFHEEQHLRQREIFQENSTHPFIKEMAHTDLIRQAFPMYYEYSYFNNINEINAELQGIKKTRAFFHTYFPEMQVDHYLVQIINHMDQWYAPTNVSSVEEAIANLEYAQQTAYQKPVYLPFDNLETIPSSKELAKFASNPERQQAYIEAHQRQDGQATNQMLLDFITDNYPNLYRRYKCLQDEWQTPFQMIQQSKFLKKKTLHRDSRLDAFEEKYINMVEETYNQDYDAPDFFI